MIQKVLKVQNVGRLRRLGWGKGVPPAGKEVAVYAENGSGKSTFVATLRAARDGDAGPVLERRSLPEVGPPTIELLTSKGRVDFVGGAWTDSLPTIEVFDRTFVTKNVYDGREVGPDQREGLYRLALGEAEVAAALAVNDAKAKKKAADDECKAVRARIDQRCSEIGTTWEALSKVTPLSAPPTELPELETRLAALAARPDVSGLPLVAALPQMPAIKVDGLQALLNETVETVSAEAMAAVQSHIATHLDSQGESWLRQGVGYVGEDQGCPYCGQNLEGSRFATLFPVYFGEAYRRLQERIARALERVSPWDEWAAALVRTQASNLRAQSAWSQLTPLPEPPDAEPIAAAATEIASLLRALMLDKQAHLLGSLGGDHRVTRIERAIENLREAIVTYQAWVDKAAEEARRVRADHPGELARLRARVRDIRAALLAGTPTMNAEVAKLNEASQAAEQRKTEVDRAQQFLDAREASRTTAFVDHVNDALAAFGAGFRIQDLKGKASATRVVADFRIALADAGRLLHHATVAASVSKGNAPRFDTVLSEGDRTTLALAVFFAKCTTSPSADRIAVLDDPFTSLDTGRRATTIQHLNALTRACAQVWVLSHDEFFLRDAPPSRSTTWLTLTDDNGTLGFSTWDPQAACKTTYARTLSRLEDFLARKPGALQAEDAWQKVRPVLEAYLRFRFPKAWQHNEWLGDFIKKGRDGNPTVPLSPLEIDQIATWSGWANPAMHGDPHDANPTPSESEVRAVVQAVVNFVQS